MVNGSCRDTFSLNSSAWDRAYANPPIKLVQDYVKCHYTVFNIIITAFGVGSGTAGAVTPICILIICFIVAHTLGLKKTRLYHDLYTDEERKKAIEHLTTHLLMIRDAEILRKLEGGKKPSNMNIRFLIDLIEGRDELFQALENQTDGYGASSNEGSRINSPREKEDGDDSGPSSSGDESGVMGTRAASSPPEETTSPPSLRKKKRRKRPRRKDKIAGLIGEDIEMMELNNNGGIEQPEPDEIEPGPLYFENNNVPVYANNTPMGGAEELDGDMLAYIKGTRATGNIQEGNDEEKKPSWFRIFSTTKK